MNPREKKSIVTSARSKNHLVSASTGAALSATANRMGLRKFLKGVALERRSKPTAHSCFVGDVDIAKPGFKVTLFALDDRLDARQAPLEVALANIESVSSLLEAQIRLLTATGALLDFMAQFGGN